MIAALSGIIGAKIFHNLENIDGIGVTQIQSIKKFFFLK